MKVTTALLADDAALEGGKLYVHGGGWDTLMISNYPAIVARIALVFVIEVEPGEMQQPHTITVDLVDQDWQPAGLRVTGVIQAALGVMGTPGASSYVTQVLRLEQQLALTQAGTYRFVIKREGHDEPMATIPLHAKPPLQAPAG